MSEVKKQLHDSCIDFSLYNTDGFYDQLAMCSESMMDEYLETGLVSGDQIRQGIKSRTVFPCFFGSALKLQGIEALLKGISDYALIPEYLHEFGAKIFKITRDDQGNRLTHLKLTGGSLSVKNTLTNGVWEEKINQIRIYSGEKYEAVNEAAPGTICAVTGLTQTRPGEGLGFESAYESPVLEPVLSYQITLPEGCDPRQMLPKLRQLEEEEPELHIVWDEHLQEIQAQIMGEIQIEILKKP